MQLCVPFTYAWELIIHWSGNSGHILNIFLISSSSFVKETMKSSGGKTTELNFFNIKPHACKSSRLVHLVFNSEDLRCQNFLFFFWDCHWRICCMDFHQKGSFKAAARANWMSQCHRYSHRTIYCGTDCWFWQEGVRTTVHCGLSCIGQNAEPCSTLSITAGPQGPVNHISFFIMSGTGGRICAEWGEVANHFNLVRIICQYWLLGSSSPDVHVDASLPPSSPLHGARFRLRQWRL